MNNDNTRNNNSTRRFSRYIIAILVSLIVIAGVVIITMATQPKDTKKDTEDVANTSEVVEDVIDISEEVEDTVDIPEEVKDATSIFEAVEDTTQVKHHEEKHSKEKHHEEDHYGDGADILHKSKVTDNQNTDSNTDETNTIDEDVELKPVIDYVGPDDFNLGIQMNINDITSTITYADYTSHDTAMQVLFIRDSEDNVRLALNTCQSCKGSPYAFFVQDGDVLVCQKCKKEFPIDNIGEPKEKGCNPIPIEYEIIDNTIIIEDSTLEQYYTVFENWKKGI